jgi:hypothetical protein
MAESSGAVELSGTALNGGLRVPPHGPVTVHGRRILVERVSTGHPVAHVATEMDITHPMPTTDWPLVSWSWCTRLEVLPGGSAGPPTTGVEVAYFILDGTELRRPCQRCGRCLRARTPRTPSYRRSATCRACGGRRRRAGASGTSPGSSAITSCCWTSTLRWWGSLRSRSGRSGRRRTTKPSRTRRTTSHTATTGLFWSSTTARPNGADRQVAKFEATEAACAEVGWAFRLLGAAGPVVVRNVRWLAGYPSILGTGWSRRPRDCGTAIPRTSDGAVAMIRTLRVAHQSAMKPGPKPSTRSRP